MAKKITASISLTMQRARPDVCAKANQPQGSIEVLDNDGIRMNICETEEAAVEFVRSWVGEALCEEVEVDVDGVVQ